MDNTITSTLKTTPCTLNSQLSLVNKLSQVDPVKHKKRTTSLSRKRNSEKHLPEKKKLRFEDTEEDDCFNEAMMEAADNIENENIEKANMSDSVCLIGEYGDNFDQHVTTSTPIIQNAQRMLDSETPDGLNESAPAGINEIVDNRVNGTLQLSIPENLPLLPYTEIPGLIQLKYAQDCYNFDTNDVANTVLKHSFAPPQELWSLYTTSSKDSKTFQTKVFLISDKFDKFTISETRSTRKKIEIKSNFFNGFFSIVNKIMQENAVDQICPNNEYGDYILLQKDSESNIKISQCFKITHPSREDISFTIAGYDIHHLLESCYETVRVISFGEKCRSLCEKTMERTIRYLEKTSVQDETRDKYMCVLYFYHSINESPRIPIHIAMKSFISAHSHYPWSLAMTPTYDGPSNRKNI